jgi:CSLREA domain-containing protein
VFAACTQDQPPTAPVAPGEMAESHTAGHKVVNSLADPGNGVCNAAQCTLREAINDPASTEIGFAQGLAGPITLASPAAGGGTLVIQKSLAITGSSAGIVIRRRSTDPAFRILRIGPGITVALTNLTIRGSKPIGPGGAILNHGTLALTNCKVVDNPTTGINSFGPLTLTNSTVAHNAGAGIVNHEDLTLRLRNSAVRRNAGVGISNNQGTLVIGNSAVTRNGGGISDLGGTVTISNSEVAYNTGGGISQHRGTSTLDHVRIVGNSTPGWGGGIRLSNTHMSIANSTIARNSAAEGGGIFNWFKGHLTITNSTIANNTASGGGGGVRSQGRPRAGVSVSLTNSTVSGNSASFGGGIFSTDHGETAAITTLVNSTVAFNSATQTAGGIGQSGIEDASLGLTNSVVAQNRAPTAPDVSSSGPMAFVDASFSLIGDGTGSTVTNDNGNQVGNVSPNTSPIDPRLGPLADKGGPTETHALLLGSPAIDAASTPACPTTDQRGVLRPQGAACDIGSYERK